MSAVWCVLFDCTEWTGHWACSVSVQLSQAASSQVSFDHPMLLSDESIVHALKMLGNSHYTHSIWFSFATWARARLLEFDIGSLSLL